MSTLQCSDLGLCVSDRRCSTENKPRDELGIYDCREPCKLSKIFMRECNSLQMPFELIWFALCVLTLIIGKLGSDF